MKIGISTTVRTPGENWERIKHLISLGYKHIELYNQTTRVRAEDIASLRNLKKKKRLTYSFHSMTQDLFCVEKIISASELACLRGEIQLASLIGCNHLVFHISRKNLLTRQEIKELNLLSAVAKKSSIKLCLENNSSSGVFSGDYLIRVLNQVKDLNFCLDVGHLNIAINKGLVANTDVFLRAIKKMTIQLHVHFNNGQQDQHLAPKMQDAQYFDKILHSVKNNNLFIIIETKNINQAAKTNRFLQKCIKN